MNKSIVQGLAGAVQGIDNRLRDALVGEKMLAEGLLGAYFHVKSVIPTNILIIFCYFCKLKPKIVKPQ